MHDHIHQSNLIEGINFARADKNCMKAWLWLLEQPKLTHEVIQQLQKLITLHQIDLKPREKGYYRTIQVYVGSHVLPAPQLVQGLMDNWLLDFMQLNPLDAHIRFEKIHPFVDGNGRTGRMLMWWHELHIGELPTKFMDWDKHEVYYPLFR